ncbi:MAG TPA: ATP-binding protein [Anaerolineales bacterium]|nr:ATP-binding protein [Anaerolineales bacterium]
MSFRVSLRQRSRLIPAAIPYLLTVLLTSLATGVLFVLRGSISPAIVALLYLLPVGLSTFLWGLGPGILAAFAAFLAFNYFFILPYYTLFVHQTQDLLALLVFLGVAVVISQMVGRMRASLARATDREREAVRLAELSTQLAGVKDEQAIAQALAERALEAFQADRVDIYVEGQSGSQPILLQKSGANPPGVSKPDLLIPLQSGHGMLGEVRLWRQDPPLRMADERLLLAFASQGVLALERARLSQAETRARVLEESDRLKSSLLSSVSHELRSPLATIKAGVSSLRSGEVSWESEARVELMEMIEEETDRLNRLVGNLLNMSRIEAGALHPQRRWNVLSEIVGGVVKRMEMAARQHRIEVDVPADLPLVPVDYLQMEQVFGNLISNSLKYSPPGTTVRICARPGEGQVVTVQVSNQGPPVPQEHLERIFDKFYRITASDRITGTGLGLSICKGIVEAHGGRIWAENLPGGFAFNFTLPSTWDGLSPLLEAQ